VYRACVLGLWLTACSLNFDAFDPQSGGADAAHDVSDDSADAMPGMDASVDASSSDVEAGVALDADATGPCNGPGAVSFAGHCYFALGANQDFTTATSTCVAGGAHLVTITSSAESGAIASINPGVDRWIGLSKAAAAPPVDSSYQWITGEARAGYSNWSPGEPNGSGNCVRMKAGGVQWADDECTNLHDAVCERE